MCIRYHQGNKLDRLPRREDQRERRVQKERSRRVHQRNQHKSFLVTNKQFTPWIASVLCCIFAQHPDWRSYPPWQDYSDECWCCSTRTHRHWLSCSTERLLRSYGVDTETQALHLTRLVRLVANTSMLTWQEGRSGSGLQILANRLRIERFVDLHNDVASNHKHGYFSIDCFEEANWFGILNEPLVSTVSGRVVE